jgi:hypothetical protein
MIKKRPDQNITVTHENICQRLECNFLFQRYKVENDTEQRGDKEQNSGHLTTNPGIVRRLQVVRQIR